MFWGPHLWEDYAERSRVSKPHHSPPLWYIGKVGISLYPLRPEKEHSLHDFLPRGLPHQQAVNVESTAAKRAVAEYALLGGGRFSRSVGRTLRGGESKKDFSVEYQ